MRILLVDDHAVVRDGIRRMFDEPGAEVFFGEARSSQEALKLVREEAWDGVVLDISLGGRNGLEVLNEMKKIHPELPVLVLSMHSEEQYARRAFKSGASGYITKDSSRAEIVSAIKKVISGGTYVSSAFAEKLAADIGRRIDGPPHSILSDREFEVLRLVGSGKTVSEIAEVLSLSDKTISTYRSRILEKMKLKTTAELIRYAIENKLAE